MLRTIELRNIDNGYKTLNDFSFIIDFIFVSSPWHNEQAPSAHDLTETFFLSCCLFVYWQHRQLNFRLQMYDVLFLWQNFSCEVYQPLTLSCKFHRLKRVKPRLWNVFQCVA